MVGHDSHGDVGLLVGAVFHARDVGYFVEERSEHVGVVVGVFVLHGSYETFEAHAGVDVVVGERFEFAVCFTVVLHEDEVPDLDDLWVVFVDEVSSAYLFALVVGAHVYMDFGAGAAGACVAHFPEVVVFVAVDDAVFVDVLGPGVEGFGVAGHAVFFGAFEYCDVESVFVEAYDVGEEFPGVGYCLVFEVVAEGPVAEHFEHGVVVGVVSYFLEVVVFAGDAKAFLAIADAAVGYGDVAEDDVLELVHACVGEHERWVALYDHWGRGDDLVTLRTEEVQEALTNFVGCHFVLRLVLMLLLWQK